MYIKYRIRIESHDALNLSLRIALSIAFRHEAHDFFLSSVGNFLNVLSLIKSIRGSLSNAFFSCVPEQLQSTSSSLSKIELEHIVIYGW